MAPVVANIYPIFSSSNLGHNIPGVSNTDISLSTLSHLKAFVTPGLFFASKLFLPFNEFINVLLPTFGIPIIKVLTVEILFPLKDFIASFNSFIPFPLLESIFITFVFSSVNLLIHLSVSSGSAKSTLFKTIILFILDFLSIISTKS